MLVNAGDIYFVQDSRLIFGILSGLLTLCMLMLFGSFSPLSLLMVMSSLLGYLGCDIIEGCVLLS